MARPQAFEALKVLCPTISVGILAADLLSLGSEISLLEGTDVGLMHFDVMDGCFCPMMTVGPPFIKAVKTNLLKDIHLMIQDPLPKLGDYVSAGADILTVHVESCVHIHRVLQEIGKMTNANDPERGLVRGLALNPGTPLEAVQHVLDEVDLILLLAVNPGWGGQKFIESTQTRLAKAREMISSSGKDILLGLDGGIMRDNIANVAQMGADIVVTGSAVFDGKAPAENMKFMLNALCGS